jgi:predicted MPP superfamily phosphohydrolase
MPWNLEFFLLRKDVLCKMGLRRGLHKVNDIKVYLNRGLGNVVVPFRFLSRPEITVIYFN